MCVFSGRINKSKFVVLIFLLDPGPGNNPTWTSQTTCMCSPLFPHFLQTETSGHLLLLYPFFLCSGAAAIALPDFKLLFVTPQECVYLKIFAEGERGLGFSRLRLCLGSSSQIGRKLGQSNRERNSIQRKRQKDGKVQVLFLQPRKLFIRLLALQAEKSKVKSGNMQIVSSSFKSLFTSKRKTFLFFSS